MPRRDGQRDSETYLAGLVVDQGASVEHPDHDLFQGFVTLHFQGGDRLRHRLKAARRLRSIVQCQLRRKAGYAQDIRQRSEVEIDRDNCSAIDNARARQRRIAEHRERAAVQAFNRNNSVEGRRLRSRWADHRTTPPATPVPRHSGAPAVQAFNSLLDMLDAQHEVRHAR